MEGNATGILEGLTSEDLCGRCIFLPSTPAIWEYRYFFIYEDIEVAATCFVHYFSQLCFPEKDHSGVLRMSSSSHPAPDQASEQVGVMSVFSQTEVCDAGAVGGGLTYCATVLAPKLIL